MAKRKFISTLLQPGGLIIRFSSPFINHFAHHQFMDILLRSKFTIHRSRFVIHRAKFIHLSSRARFVHHRKLRSSPVSFAHHQSSFVHHQSSFVQWRSNSRVVTQFLYHFFRLWRSCGPRHHLYLLRRLFRPQSHRWLIRTFLKVSLQYFAWRMDFVDSSGTPCRVQHPLSPFLPHRRTQCCGQSFMRVRLQY